MTILLKRRASCPLSFHSWYWLPCGSIREPYWTYRRGGHCSGGGGIRMKELKSLGSPCDLRLLRDRRTDVYLVYSTVILCFYLSSCIYTLINIIAVITFYDHIFIHDDFWVNVFIHSSRTSSLRTWIMSICSLWNLGTWYHVGTKQTSNKCFKINEIIA